MTEAAGEDVTLEMEVFFGMELALLKSFALLLDKSCSMSTCHMYMHVCMG